MALVWRSFSADLTHRTPTSLLIKRSLDGAVNAPHRSIEQALAFAYGMEVRAVCKLACWQGRGGGTKGADPFAAHAEAAMMLALIRRTLGGAELCAMEAQQTVPSGSALRSRKHRACCALASDLAGGTGIDSFYALEVTREWAGLYRNHDDAWWAKHLRLSERRLRQLKHGRAERSQPGLMGRLDEVYDRALARLAPVLVERELVESAWDSRKAAY
jgi:hypothetical protein